MQDLLILGIIPGTNVQISFEGFLIILCAILLSVMTAVRQQMPEAKQARDLRLAAKLTDQEEAGSYEAAPRTKFLGAQTTTLRLLLDRIVSISRQN